MVTNKDEAINVELGPETIADVAEQVEEETQHAQTPEPAAQTDLPSVIPNYLADLMRVNQVSADEIMQVIWVGGFMPQGTPLENVPTELWGHLASNWDKVLNMLETQIRN